MTFCPAQNTPAKTQPLALRLLQYMDERFPPLPYGLMTALFVLAGISLSSVLRLGHLEMSVWQFAVGFAVIFSLFFQLRVADEWKDRQEDALYQSERPVPRGLISLKELTWVAAATAFVQILLVALFDRSMLALLAVIWTYFFFMSREFFCPAYLRKRPALYVLSHMFILVLSDLFITALDWWHNPTTLEAATGAGANLICMPDLLPPALMLFLAGSFANGLVIELGRKTRNSKEERPGVESYSKLLGLNGALYLLLACMIAAHILIGCAIAQLSGGVIAGAVLALMDMIIVMIGCLMTREEMQTPLTNISSLSVLLSYLVVFVSAICASAHF